MFSHKVLLKEPNSVFLRWTKKWTNRKQTQVFLCSYISSFKRGLSSPSGPLQTSVPFLITLSVVRWTCILYNLHYSPLPIIKSRYSQVLLRSFQFWCSAALMKLISFIFTYVSSSCTQLAFDVIFVPHLQRCNSFSSDPTRSEGVGFFFKHWAAQCMQFNYGKPRES